MVKLQRVCGGCLGAKRRRRTWGSCEKLGRAATKRGPRDLLTGKPGEGHASSSLTESIGEGGRPGELKHLSTPRKRKKAIDCVSSGERKRKSPNSMHASLPALCIGGCESFVGTADPRRSDQGRA